MMVIYIYILSYQWDIIHINIYDGYWYDNYLYCYIYSHPKVDRIFLGIYGGWKSFLKMSDILSTYIHIPLSTDIYQSYPHWWYTVPTLSRFRGSSGRPVQVSPLRGSPWSCSKSQAVPFRMAQNGGKMRKWRENGGFSFFWGGVYCNFFGGACSQEWSFDQLQKEWMSMIKPATLYKTKITHMLNMMATCAMYSPNWKRPKVANCWGIILTCSPKQDSLQGFLHCL